MADEFVDVVPQRCPVRVINAIGKFFCGCRVLKWLGIPVLTLDRTALEKTAKRRCADKKIPALDEGKITPEGVTQSVAETKMMQYRKPLDIVMKDLGKMDLTLVGTMLMHNYFSNIIATRMQVMQYIRQNYLALNRIEIKRPVFVVGLPRCGTTITYNLLASDPNVRFVPNWQAQCPTLPEAKAKAEVGMGLKASHWLVPDLKKVHDFGIDDPEECIVWMGQTFICYLFVVLVNMPGYWEFLYSQNTDMEGVYRYHKYILQILEHRFPQPRTDGKGNKRWVLKSPAHLPYIDFLLQMYPDAQIVWNHRDVVSAFASSCSLVKHFQMLSHEKVDRKAIGQHVLTSSQVWLNRALEARRKYPDNFYDLRFDDLIKDPVEAVHKVYDRFGYDWTPDVEKALRAKYADMPRNKHGEHKYTLAQYGLTTETLESKLAPYYQFLAQLKEGKVEEGKSSLKPEKLSVPPKSMSSSTEGPISPADGMSSRIKPRQPIKATA